tara:strand:+ start:1925 stop:2209 length:285 start_codon:yes stop_codon:yes gene_type:complete
LTTNNQTPFLELIPFFVWRRIQIKSFDLFADPFAFICAGACSLAAVALSLRDPVMQRLWRTSDLAWNRHEGRPLRGVICPMFLYHPNRSFAHLG